MAQAPLHGGVTYVIRKGLILSWVPCWCHLEILNFDTRASIFLLCPELHKLVGPDMVLMEFIVITDIRPMALSK